MERMYEDASTAHHPGSVRAVIPLSRARLSAAVAFALAGAMLAGTPVIATAETTVQAGDVTFPAQAGGTYDGMPLFDGNPSNLDAYLDTLIDYVGIEGAIYWANGQRGDFTILSGPNAGKVVPGAPLYDEGGQGISTDFPAPIAVGQTWNPDLAREVGQVIGEENLYENDFLDSISTFNPMLTAAAQDIRVNPLSGRLDEGYGEDPRHASIFIDQSSRGMTGIDAAENADGFWTKNMLDTKHYTGYLAQWFRRTADNSVSARGLMEYQSLPGMAAIESGAIDSLMTSFGRTNGVPNIISPLITEAQSRSPWGLYSTNDINGHRELSMENAFSNGFDITYTPSQDTATALMAIAHAGSIAVNDASGSPANAALLRQLENGTYGVTVEDVESLAKTQIVPLVRMGLFNERDEQGYPKHYPFVDLSAASPVALNYSHPAHQQTALQAAQESIILLKNEGNVLPLAEGTRPAVVGPLADARFRTTRGLNSPDLPGAGLTPLQGIEQRAGADLLNATDGNVIALRSVASGGYLTHEAGAAPKVTAGAAGVDSAALFESFAWGQESYSLRSQVNGQWLRFAANAVTVSGTEQFGTQRTQQPYRLRMLNNADGTVSFVVENFDTSFRGGFETRFYTNGRYLTVDPATNEVGVTGVLTDAATAKSLNTDATKFALETVRPTGSQAASFAQEDGAQYAVVVVGTSPRHSAGEGSDRSDLALGTDQYELVDTVSAAYPGRTIVVLSTTTPVLAEQIQRNEDVAAVVQLPDSGQFGGLALGQLLYGDYAPSGRVNQTWYASMDALPELHEYSIPEGQDALVGLEDLDPRFSVDMTNGDPYQTGLTYAYTDAPVTYEFGYGLSYSDFEYGRLRVNAPRGETSSGTATVTVTNTGSVDAAEVVQLYAANPGSTYGDAAPKRQLVTFAKVDIAAGESKEVTLEFDSEALALWNTNTRELDVEAGSYTFMAGRSSDDIRATEKVRVQGERFGTTDASTAPVNVFDHSFKASDVVYREASKQNTVEGLREDALVHGYHVVMSREPGAWTAINDVKFNGVKKAVLSVASTNDSSSVELRLDGPDGRLIGQATFGNTGVAEYEITGSTPAGNIPVREIGYQDVTIDLDRGLGGIHDLYVVFGDKDVRVKDLHIQK